nr:MAG TPA: hypothetical protein [Caudoviricetes sp.]
MLGSPKNRVISSQALNKGRFNDYLNMRVEASVSKWGALSR